LSIYVFVDNKFLIYISKKSQLPVNGQNKASTTYEVAEAYVIEKAGVAG